MTTSNTAPQQVRPHRRGTFTKGDPRINRKGRPRSFDQLRALAQQIAHEQAKRRDGDALEIGGHLVTQVEAIVRELIHKNPEKFLEIAYGKAPDETILRGHATEPVEIKIVSYRAALTAVAPRPVSDSDTSSAG